ncbi:MAG: hypothetical protein Q4D29_11045 [Lachnospiraceae bacterium]|nr:hypothetical protein [Lachnospiraceae bacterium]
MAFYSKNEMKELLLEYPQYREQLYNRGFLISNIRYDELEEYPFYSNWTCTKVETDGNHYYIYINKNTYLYTYISDNRTYFLIGHAYNPYTMMYLENDILQDLADCRKKGIEQYWDKESELTGVFCLGYFSKGNVFYSTDCCGMQLVYHGTVDGNFFLTSHSKLVADLTGIQQTKYIKKLVSNRFWHYWGTWLPGDLSPFKELSRMVPNCAGKYNAKNQEITVKRYYPTREIKEFTTEEEYVDCIHNLGDIMSKNMTLIAQKWPDKKVSISVTGGRDSMTALSCTKGNYDKYSYFSYISNYDESVDAYAARDILAHLGLEHELYEIPEEWDEYKNLDAFKKVMECNNGCIGANNENDARKRLYFSMNPPCDMEVKSWVNEMGRGWYYNKYNKKHFPKYPNASYWRAMHKVYATPYLIHETNKVFKDYLKKYYSKSTFDKMDWLEMYFWEFAWSGGEGVFLTSEHRVSYDITIPFNNRKYVEMMLRVPVEKRKVDDIPVDLITYMEPRIAETGITVHDISHTSMRALIVRIYLEIMSRVHI